MEPTNGPLRAARGEADASRVEPVVPTTDPSSLGERRHAVIAMASTTTWRTRVALPTGLAHGAPPEPVEKSTAAGRYTARYEVGEDGVLAIERELVIAKDRYAADEYPALRELLLAVLVDEERVLMAERVSE